MGLAQTVTPRNSESVHWHVVAPFIRDEHARWLHDFAPSPSRRFSVHPARYTHDRSRPETGARQWHDYWAHARAVMSMSSGKSRQGMICVFPQLAMCAGVQKLLHRRSGFPIVAWCFNVGALYGGAKGIAARLAATRIDRFVVHSTAEVLTCSHWLGVEQGRFEFVPLQRPLEIIQMAEDDQTPFILAMGSARRDYALFMRVVSSLGIPAVVVAGEHALRGIDVPGNVRVLRNLSNDQCNELIQRARLCVVPIDNDDTASGQVTVIDAMMFGRAVVATRCAGTVDYMTHGVDGVLVDRGSESALSAAIAGLWNDASQRKSLGSAARARVSTGLSDEAAGAHLGRILAALEQQSL